MCGSMPLYKYFTRKDKLLHPIGPLSLSWSSSTIVAANGEVTKVMDSKKEKPRRIAREVDTQNISLAVKIELASKLFSKCNS